MPGHIGGDPDDLEAATIAEKSAYKPRARSWPKWQPRVPMLRSVPRLKRVQCALLLLLTVGVLAVWLTVDLLFQVTHNVAGHAYYDAWSNGWMSCGWRKAPLLSYWNSSTLAVTGETSCRLPDDVWFMWRAQPATSESAIADAPWRYQVARPAVYAQHHYVYRGFIPLTIGADTESFAYRWGWQREMTAESIVSAATIRALDKDNSLQEDRVVHMAGPASSDENAALHIGLIADNQYKKTPFLRLLRHMAARAPVAWLHLGDGVQHAHELRGWEVDFFQPIYVASLHRTPLIYARGNHDDTLDHWYWGHDQGHLYHQPDVSWFAVTVAGVRWIVLDSNRDTPAQEAFLAEALQSEEARQARFVVVLVHIPPFIEFWDPRTWRAGERNWGSFVRERYVPLFKQHRVDLVISGHQHNYQRSRADNGTVYAIVGGGGGALDDERVEQWQLYEKTLIQHHYVMLSLTDQKLHWQAFDLNNNLVDEFQLTSRQQQQQL